ncbi:pheromone-binding protein [Enterococcus haemoperoxidus ATCC BAA-382]|uniref:Pheromone-binding protein n=1 Tax=Enterococcus haemoperoxidus ATCC BAA-382 TaxID=1158608 RepID=R2QHA0_9ENTE|nr:peptide ABC transporter substrate-binding protein [Enterococcus haemoperoxidus]EOH94593.1 pheromone-binding protein [Enterococcus haemoperoxidus ATCC BAA-382]EOT63235.1 pheromone-binding protein [Enterococcus haemoperoxidus ATCC BAA-382]OJG54098.1 pheromone-binding protein [Enterococcus haemoperoxidus]
MKKGIKAIIGLTLMLTIISGCSGGKEATKSQETKPLNLMSPSELTTLDTSVMLDFPDAIVQTAAFEGLYALDDKDQLIPAAAKEMPEISEDGKTYKIKLREEAKWSNDDPVTAADFEYAWKKMIDPKNGFVYSFLVADTILNAEEISKGEKPVDELGVKAIDDQTLEIKLKEAKPYFTSVLAFPTFFPQNQKFVEKMGTDYGTTSENVIYNGPFTVANWKQTDLSWDLKKNEKYWDQANVKSDKIHYEVVKEASTALNLFEDGQLDVATVTGELAKQNQSNPNYHSYPTATMNYIRLNQKRKDKETPLKNENLRKALALGIDKENLVNNIIADGSKPLYGAVTEGFVSNPETGVDFREEAGDLMTYNKDEALKYWTLAKKELGDNITLDLMVTDDGSYKKMGESLQGSLEKLFEGLTINVTALPTETALNLSRESDYDMFLIYWTPDYQDPISTLNMLRTGNDRNYSNAKYDALLDDASQKYATDLEKRWETLITAEKVGIEDTAGMIIISQNQQSVLQNEQVKGVNYHTFAAPLTLKNIYKEAE